MCVKPMYGWAIAILAILFLQKIQEQFNRLPVDRKSENVRHQFIDWNPTKVFQSISIGQWFRRTVQGDEMFGSLHQVVYTDYLIVGMECTRHKKIGNMKKCSCIHFKVQLFAQFAEEAFLCAFAEVESAARELAHEGVEVEFFGDEYFAKVVVQECVNANIEPSG